LVYTTPRLKASSIVEGYSEGIDTDYTSQEQARIKTFQKNLKILNSFTKSKGRLLDVGAAAGYFVKVAADNNWQAEGVEPSSWMSQYAQDKLGVKVRPGTIHNYRFKSNSFDVITYWDVLEHVPDPKKDLKKTAKLLKKGGLLIVNYPDWASLPAKIFGRKWWFVLSIHLYYFTPVTITKLLKKTGFRVLDIRPHFQTLELGYLVYRLKPYSRLLYNILNPIVKILNLDKFGIPYYAGQTLVIAKKK
jgi:2-polyprenyl-3-methyl-5-hydroxy-6-metoxy-1,4-benzoquinol methylase